ncbi:MAG TPA: sigma-70 family RNA polymerase sigma factor [Candidatus Angelobacter sp.]|jgi:RNA polymerase sigma factor (sigma-70 family)|nr:sigma-70 family RNA polymerase sigma factor [Candidatus Angelobacter sp.]
MTTTSTPPETESTSLPTGPPGTSVDAQLALRARDGDREAFGELYSRHVQHVHDFVRSQLRDADLVEDITQTTFLHALEHIGELRDGQGVRAWLFRIARNNVRMHVRRAHMESLDSLVEQEEFDAESPDPTPEAAAVSSDLRGLVWTAAHSLDERQFAVLDMSLRHDLSSNEIGDVLGTSHGHAAVLVHRAREALGGAVRTLTVARAQTVCPRLRELVPEGHHGPLTATQRRSVEHHMRTCAECRDLADRMTAPPELLSGIVLLPLPAALAHPGWLHAAQGAPQAAQLASQPWWRKSVRIGRGVRVPLAALGVAGAVATAGVAGGIAAVTHRTSSSAPPVSIAGPRFTPHAGGAVPTTAPTAVPTPTVADESTKAADAVWADMLTTTRAAQSYHIVFATTSLSDDVTQFDVRFARGGDYAGTVTLALASHDPFAVCKVNGTLYAQGAAIVHQPDLFGLTPDQAAHLGSGWLQLTGGQARQDVATLIDRTLSTWGDPHQLADTLLQPTGAVHQDGTDSINGEPLVILRDDTGTMSVTRFGAQPRRASNGIDTVIFSEFNVPVTVTAPAGALVLS